MSEKNPSLKISTPPNVILTPPLAGEESTSLKLVRKLSSRPILGDFPNQFRAVRLRRIQSLRSFRMTNRELRKIFLLSCLILFFLGCYPAARLKIPPEELNPEKVLEKAIYNQNQIKTSASLINFNLKSSKGSFSGDLELFLKKPDSLSFRIKAFLGPNLMEGVVYGNTFLFYFPRLKRYYEGISLNCSEEEIYQTEINLFCLLKILTLETQLKKIGTIYRGTDKKNFIYEQRGKILKKSFWVDINEAYLRKSMWEEVDYSTPEEVRGFVIEYKDFRKISGIKIPQEIKIKSLDEKEKLRLKFLEMKINSPISEKKFQIKIPEEAKPLEIE